MTKQKFRPVFLAKVTWAAGCFFSSAGWAAQMGQVTAETAEIHQLPNSSSPEIGTLSKNTQIRLSSELTRDIHNQYWYKVRLPLGDLGYIRAKDVWTESLGHQLKAAEVDSVRAAHEDADVDPAEAPGMWVVRVLGLAGYEVNSRAFEGGAEAEASVSLMPIIQGQAHWMVSAGLAYQGFGSGITSSWAH